VLNKIAKDKSLRILFVGFFLFFMVWQPTPAYAEVASATITCMDSAGNIITRQIGWDNENNYFLDKGNIPQHYCEGGFAGQFTTFVGVVSSDGTELDPALLYHPGYVAPAPDDSEPDNSVEEETTETVERTENVIRSEDVERTDEPATADNARTEEVVREPEPVATVAPEPTTQPTLEPEPSPEPTPEDKPTPEPAKTPVEAPKPSESPSPSPEPSEPPTSLPEPQVPSEPAPEFENSVGVMLAFEAIGKLVDNLRLIGSDMTPEVREQAQQVVVASVIVTQIALAGRKP
jgi:outer membrane biosynthesis protein TonB